MVNDVAERVATVTAGQVWSALRAVPDPEIPVISVVDLGIVRDVECNGRAIHIIVTPTYAGCPATEVIIQDITAAIVRLGVKPSIAVRLDPAWTTDWLSNDARIALERYGIAAPGACHAERTQTLRFKPRCPRCNDLNTELLSSFGATPCKALYRCTGCREPFEYFKPI